MDVIDELRTISADANLQEMLDAVEDDIDLYLNETREDVFLSVGMSTDNYTCSSAKPGKTTNIGNQSIDNNIYWNIVPNPIKGTHGNIIIESTEVGEGRMAIYNIAGIKVVDEPFFIVQNGKTRIDFSTDKLAINNVYLCILYVNGIKTFKAFTYSSQ